MNVRCSPRIPRLSAVHTPQVGLRRTTSTRHAVGLISCAGLALLAGGCETDSYIDPSIIGRWEHTPTSVPILDRISVIEDDTGDFIETSDVTPDDLVAEAKEYRIAPGDRLQVTLYDFEERGRGTELVRDVDLQGNIDIPQLGLINLVGLTPKQAEEEIGKFLARLVVDPLVSIVPVAQRNQTFTVVGAVETPGPYFIPRPDYRLIEALTASGRFPETTEEIYIIRQIPLDDSMTRDVRASVPSDAPRGNTQTTPASESTTPVEQPSGEKLIDLIDELSKPDGGTQDTTDSGATPAGEPKADAPVGGGSPGLLASIDLDGTSTRGSRRQPDSPQPAVDLIDAPDQAKQPAVELRDSDEPTWIFVNGEWVMVKPGDGAAGRSPARGAAPADGVSPVRTDRDSGSSAGDISQLVTQRVIRVPVKPLLAGDARYNVVVRPGDTIRVPTPVAGLVYMTGQVQRPGPYSLPDVGKLTLLRALDSAGGLSAIAIPERCDITRIVGKDRQATIRVNLRSIAEQTEPDLYLKPDDRINVGTNFWALPLAVFRGGFRTNYGFGFVIDRNFGNDVFGPPPENRSF